MGEKPTELDERKQGGEPHDYKREAGTGQASGFAINEPGVGRVGGGGTAPTPAETSNLNLSTSNINRQGASGPATGEIGNAPEPSGLAVSDPGAPGDKAKK